MLISLQQKHKRRKLIAEQISERTPHFTSVAEKPNKKININKLVTNN